MTRYFTPPVGIDAITCPDRAVSLSGNVDSAFLQVTDGDDVSKEQLVLLTTSSTVEFAVSDSVSDVPTDAHFETTWTQTHWFRKLAGQVLWAKRTTANTTGTASHWDG